MSYTKENRWYR